MVELFAAGAIGDRLRQAQDSYNDAHSKLTRNRGNVIRQAEMLKQLGTKPANPDGKGWVNKVGGEVASRHRTQENAAERGREFARENHSEHSIHRRNGTIGEKNSYGNDFNPPRDKNR